MTASGMPLTRRTIVWLIVGAAGSITVMVAVLSVAGSGSEGWLLSARYTARLSFVMFLISFLAPRWLSGFSAQDARDAFLAFAAAHFGHFAALMTYLNVSAIPMNTGQQTVGALAYVLLGSTAVWLLSGRHFHRFHAPVAHYILLVMALTYGSRLPNEDARVVGVVGVASCLVAVALRHIPTRNAASGD